MNSSKGLDTYFYMVKIIAMYTSSGILKNFFKEGSLANHFRSCVQSSFYNGTAYLTIVAISQTGQLFNKGIHMCKAEHGILPRPGQVTRPDSLYINLWLDLPLSTKSCCEYHMILNLISCSCEQFILQAIHTFDSLVNKIHTASCLLPPRSYSVIHTSPSSGRIIERLKWGL